MSEEKKPKERPRRKPVPAMVAVLEAVGGQRALARILKITQPAVNKMVYGRTRISWERAVQLEKATKGAVTVKQLLPKLFKDRPV